MNSKSLLKGTIILILAGVTTRLIGFFYKIYLSNLLGEKNLGIYQLIFPIYSICYTIYASGIQTGISKLIASISSKKNKLSPFFTGAILSIFLSCTLSITIYNTSDCIASYILHEPLCAPSLRILSLVFPFCGITACINGFYYAIKKTAIPSITQLVEQVIRVAVVLFIAPTLVAFSQATHQPCELAVIGLVIGECCSGIFICLALLYNKEFFSSLKQLMKNYSSYKHHIYSIRDFLKFTVPLTFNKLLVSILGSIESILIPAMLIHSGLSNDSALSIFGVLTGMSMSFISFPATITNSLSVLLLPTISEAESNQDSSSIQKTINNTLHLSLLIGIYSLAVFLLYGNELGLVIFNSNKAGFFISVLAWLCPFMYITTTFSSILNGLGKTTITFRNSLISVIIRLGSVVLLIPKLGITGYLIGLLISSVGVCILDYISLKTYARFNIDLTKSIIKPVTISIITGLLSLTFYHKLLETSYISNSISLLMSCFIYIILLTFATFITSKR